MIDSIDITGINIRRAVKKPEDWLKKTRKLCKKVKSYKLIGIVIKAKSFAIAMQRETSYALVRSLSRNWIPIATLWLFIFCSR